jgi:hypothetical protein
MAGKYGWRIMGSRRGKDGSIRGELVVFSRMVNIKVEV